MTSKRGTELTTNARDTKSLTLIRAANKSLSYYPLMLWLVKGVNWTEFTKNARQAEMLSLSQTKKIKTIFLIFLCVYAD